MRYSTTPGYLGPTSSVPAGVKWLLISNIAIFIFTYLAEVFFGIGISHYFSLVPSKVVAGLQIWRPFTWLFFHDTGGFGHIIFNMLPLYFFGRTLEETWGTDRFLKYYFSCGLGSALCVIIAGYLTGGPGIPTIGASGAIFGLLLAFGMLFPDVNILLGFLVPIPAKYVVMIYGAIEFLSLPRSSGVSHIAHLGGMVFGYFLIRQMRRRPSSFRRSSGPSPLQRLQTAWQDYKLRRARKKFQVYMSRQNRKDDPYVH